MKPSEKWTTLREEILKRTDEIDKETSWTGETEPDWWLQMMQVRRTILNWKERK